MQVTLLVITIVVVSA